MQYPDLDTILSTTDRLPFNDKDLSALFEYIKRSRAKGYDISIDPCLERNSDSFQEALSEGFMILSSEILDHRFLFININGGVGFFGGRKRKIMVFIGSPLDFTFTPGPIFNNFLFALTGVNNIYRANIV